ncbi:FIG00554312: hypothetical protein [Cronobacter condimenti 1330]|uniref:Uncharacterized protein n=1 Tax=Cronobacter condimenti 1330 TaxID=1073999 RepID=K8A3C1_9ENTR|nr:FIG00554312: hypothetical protein [Cronobacter condimenti 1330]
MRWVPAHGGRLNASTRLCQTAFFFEAPAQRLAGFRVSPICWSPRACRPGR